MSDTIFAISDGNLITKETFENSYIPKYNPIYYLDFTNDTKTAMPFVIYRSAQEKSGTGYPFFHVEFSISDLKSKYGQKIGTSEKLYAHFVGLIKVNQQQKDQGQSSMPFISHQTISGELSQPQVNYSTNNIEYTYFHIKTEIQESWNSNTLSKIYFDCYHYPVDNNTGLQYIKNVIIYLSTDPNLQLPVYVEPTVEEGVLKTHLGVQILPQLNNLIGNGQFQNGKGIENEWDSYGNYSITLYPNNPLSNISPYVLIQRSGAGGEYEVHPRSGTSVTNQKHNMYIWSKVNSLFDGDSGIFHSRWYYTDGTADITLSVSGSVLTSYNGFDLRMHSFTPNSLKTLTGIYDWYIGYPTGGSNQNGKRYLTGQMLVPHSYDIHPLTYFEGIKQSQKLEYNLDLIDNFTIYFRTTYLSLYNQEDKTWIGLQNYDKSQYINIFNGRGFDFFLGTHTNRTLYSLTAFGYQQNDILDFFITKQGSTITIKIFKNGVLSYNQSKTDNVFNFNVYHIRIGRGFGNQDFNSTLSKSIYQRFQQYNKILTDEQMGEIINNNKKVKINRIFINGNLKENSIIPNGCIYNPLNDTQYNGDLQPVNSTGQIVTKEGTFVGLAQTNLQGNFTSWSYFGAQGTMTNTPYGTGYVFNGSCLNSGNGKISKNLSATQNTTYTFQSFVYVSENCDITDLSLKIKRYSDGYVYAQTSYNMQKKGKYQLLTTSFTQPSNETIIYIIEPVKQGYIGTDINGYYIIVQPSIVQKEYYSEFGGLQSISQGYLHFNLYNSLGLKWNQPWSILVWTKYLGTHYDNLNGYQTITLGSNSNSVGGKYIWFGKEKDSNTFRMNGIGGSGYVSGIPLNPSIWFNNWLLQQITSDGTNINIRIYSNKTKSKLYDYVVIYSDMPENGFVNQYGYDLSLSGWDNTYVIPKYVRDLMVFKRELTIQEIEEYFYTFLRMNSNNQKIRDEIFELD